MQLTDEQKSSFLRDGMLHLRGLIPAPVCRAAEDAIWATIEVPRDDPSAWPEGWTQPPGCWGLAEVRACYTDGLAAVVDQLIGKGLHDRGDVKSRSFGPIILYPRRVDPSWSEPRPHIDQHGPMHRTFVLGMICYLHDVPARSGCTAVWPGDYQRLEAAALRHRLLPVDVIRRPDLFQPRPDFHEAVAGIGDVLLYPRNGLHASTVNLSSRPRVAMQTMVHLNAEGEFHCRNGSQPRTTIEQIYDRCFAAYHRYNYFACQARNMGA